MKTEIYIARKFMQGKSAEKGISGIIKISLLAVALSTAIMIISIAVVLGFQHAIREKVIGFGGHIRIAAFSNTSSYESLAIDKNAKFKQEVKKLQGVVHVQEFATKPGIIKTKDQIEGAVLKGLGNDYDWKFFSDKIIKGRPIIKNDSAKSNEILLSSYLANKLKLSTNEKLDMYFIQDPPRVRRFTIVGIYETGLEEFDKLFVFCDIGHIQKLNNWKENQTGGYEVLVNDFEKIKEINESLYEKLPEGQDAFSIQELYPQLFDWLDLQDINGIIIIILMVLVASVNMVSAYLILILDKTNNLGILKSMGANNAQVKKIFLICGIILSARGVFWGVFSALLLCFLQLQFHFISLDQSSYFISYVPIYLSWEYLLAITMGTLFICALSLLIPSAIISRISPIKAIKFN